MPPVWLRPEAGGAWAYFPSVADATAHLKEQGIELFATQVSRAAKNAKTRHRADLAFREAIDGSHSAPGNNSDHFRAPAEITVTIQSALGNNSDHPQHTKK